MKPRNATRFPGPDQADDSVSIDVENRDGMAVAGQGPLVGDHARERVALAQQRLEQSKTLSGVQVPPLAVNEPTNALAKAQVGGWEANRHDAVHHLPGPLIASGSSSAPSVVQFVHLPL